MNVHELYWAAGFLEGEGAFTLRDRHAESKGTAALIAKASQVNPEPLYRIKAMFGGAVYGPYMNRPSMKIRNQKPFYEWSISGRGAAQVFMTLYPLMSDVRKRQIHRGLTVWKAAPLRGTAQTHCKRGHPFSAENTYIWGGHRACRICQKLHQDKYYHKKRSAQVLTLIAKGA